MTKFRDGIFGPTVILFSICLVTTLALAFTYQTTKPIIERAEAAQAEQALDEVLPFHDEFIGVIDVELPEDVLEAYETHGGYVIKARAKGFSGKVTYMIGIDEEGAVTGISVFDSNETPGLGTKVHDHKYMDLFYGHTDPDDVDAISGATMTVDSLKNSIKLARDAYDLIKEAHGNG